jgi:hypothetical protein
VTLATDVPLPAGTNNIGDVDVATLPTTEKNPTIITQAVAAAGTAEAWAGSTTTCVYFMVEARKVGGANAGNVYIGTSAVDKTTSQQIVLQPGDKYEFTAPAGYSTDLDAWYIDADNNDDGITGFYLAS